MSYVDDMIFTEDEYDSWLASKHEYEYERWLAHKDEEEKKPSCFT